MEKEEKKDKSNASEMQKRINLVYSMYMQGIQSNQIVRFISEKYSISGRQVENYITKAREIMDSDTKLELGIIKSQIVAQLWDLYHKNMKIEDYRECRNILNQIAEIFGVKAPLKSELTVKEEQPLFSDEES